MLGPEDDKTHLLLVRYFCRTAGRWVDIGEGTRAFLGIPERGQPPYRAMILGHERYGLVLDTLDQVAKFAAYGYVCIAPDFFHKHPDQAALHRGDVGYDMTDPESVDYLSAAIDELSALPQVDQGKIQGAIKDATGGVKPGVTITVKNDRTGEAREALSGAQGSAATIRDVRN